MHLPVLAQLRQTQNVSFVGVCDLDSTAATSYAGRLAQGRAGPAVHTDAAQMLKTCQPDGVLVLVNPEVSADMIRLTAHLGLPFLTEKPPAPDAATHRELIDKVADLTHVVGYNRRHCPYVAQAREWMRGIQPQSVTCLFSRYQRRDADFTTTAVHAIDTVRYLADDPLARVRIEASPAGQTISYFVNGWTIHGIRIDILMTPDTASAVEHYIVRAAQRTVFVSFPQVAMMDVPGYVELHEANAVVSRKAAADWGIQLDDFPVLGGILGEHVSFCRALHGQEMAVSTLRNTLETQQVREALSRLLAAGGRGTIDLDLTCGSPGTP